MSEKKYRISVQKEGMCPIEYRTETLELAEDILHTYELIKKRYKFTDSDFVITLEELPKRY